MARNQHLIERLIGIQAQLMAGYTGGHPMSNASKGREREEFIDLFLRCVLVLGLRPASGSPLPALQAFDRLLPARPAAPV